VVDGEEQASHQPLHQLGEERGEVRETNPDILSGEIDISIPDDTLSRLVNRTGTKLSSVHPDTSRPTEAQDRDNVFQQKPDKE